MTPTASEPRIGRRILVLTTVHQADDPRIRERTVGVLARHAAVHYATKPPPPASREGIEWTGLPGGRLRRAVAGLAAAWRSDLTLVSLHDPELIPVGLLVRWVRRVPVVLDVHENVPAQLHTKHWVPPPARRPLAALARWSLRVAERHLVITLAEDGYRALFRRDHPVLANYPLVDRLPDPRPDGGYLVYVGDVTEARGASLLVRAVAGLASPRPLRMVGRCAPALRSRLRALAGELGVDLEVTGFLPHGQAMAVAAGASVGLSPLSDIPNYRDSLPTKVVEYLCLGVPVVASDLPGTTRVVGGLPGVHLVPPDDVAAWTTAIDAVAGDPGERTGAAANAAAVRGRFSWPADDLWGIYQSAAALAANRPSKP